MANNQQHVSSRQEYCLDLFEPAGHGKRKRRTLYGTEIHNVTHRVGRNRDLKDSQALTNDVNETTQYAKFNENIEYTVLMPGGMFSFLTKHIIYSSSTCTSR